MHLIDEKLLIATIQYLAARPYGEVYQLIAALQDCKEAPEAENKEAEEELAGLALFGGQEHKVQDDATSTH